MNDPLYLAGIPPRPLRSGPDGRYNRPDLDQLAYRVGTYSEFVQYMSQQIHSWTDARTGGRPLQRLNLGMPGEIGAAMLKAWAAVGDVLTFYQERIANEGYLATSREPFSVRTLAAQIGYQPPPALAATTYLAYTLHDVKGAPRIVQLPSGPELTVQSLPADGQMPQIFESDESVLARVEWNALRPWRPAAEATHALAPDATVLRLDGVRPLLKAGTPFLVRGQAGGASAWALCRADVLEPDRAGGFTLLHFTRLAGSDNATAAIDDIALLALDRSRALFGAGAPRWDGLPDSVKQRYATRSGGPRISRDGGLSWLPNGDGMPDTVLRTLLITPGGALLAGGPGGIWRCAGAGRAWSAVRVAGRRGCHQLLADRDGNLFAACDNGTVLRSNDGGDSWLSLAVSVEPKATSALVVRRTLAPTVRGAIRALAFAPRAGDAELGLLAAGDSGVFLNQTGSGWAALSKGLPGHEDATGLTSAPVLCLWSDTVRGRIWAGTQQGPFCCDLADGSWRAAAGAMPPQLHVYAMAGCDGGGEHVLFAATSQGLWRSKDDGAHWEQVVVGKDAPAPEQPAILALAVQAGAAPRVLAGTGDGVFFSTDLGASWQAAGAPYSSGAPVTALAASGGLLAAAAPYGGFIEQEWPGFRPLPGQIDLDRVQPGLLPGAWLALCQPGAALPYVVAQAGAEQRVLRSDFMLTASVSRLTLTTVLLPAGHQGADADPLAQVSLRDCSVALQGAQLPLFQPQSPPFCAVGGATLDIEELAIPFRPQHVISLSGQAASVRLALPLGGVYAPDANAWPDAALAGQDVRVLSCDPAGTPHAGTADGVFRLAAGRWEMLAPLKEVNALLFDGQGRLYAGTPDGLFLWSGGAWQDAGLGALSVSALGLDHDGALMAAVDQPPGRAGVHVRDDDGAWLACSAGLATVAPSALLRGADGVYLGTNDAGVFHLPRGTLRWVPLSDGLGNWNVRTLACDRRGAIWAGTVHAGLYRLVRGRWRRSGAAFAQADVRAVLAAADGTLYAAAIGDGVYCSNDDGASWQRWGALAGNALTSLALGPDGRLLVGTASLCMLEQPDGRHMTLSQPPAGVLAAAFADEIRQGYLSPSLRLAFSKLRLVLGESAALRVDRAGCAWLDDGVEQQWLMLVQHDGVRLYDNPRLHAIEGPSDTGAVARWTLDDRSGARGRLCCTAPQLLLQPAAKDNPQLGEIAAIAASAPGPAPGVIRLTLAKPLVHAYDPDTLVVCANVARASHGETVPQDVIGSGNGSLANQSFALHRAPLTYLNTPKGPRSTLGIYLRPPRFGAANPAAEPSDADNSIRWDELDTLAEAEASTRGYLLSTDRHGNATVTFGDGVHGARLPTGTENVLAKYRVGAGTVGNLAAGQLSRLRRRPLGVSKVSNPVEAEGGIDAEPLDQIRANAPRSISALGRIVSLSDYAVYARSTNSVAKSAVQTVWTGKRRVVQLSLAGRAGALLDQASLQALRRDIDSQRASATALHLGNYEPCPFQLNATVLVAPSANVDSVQTALRATLLTAFGFDARELGQPVAASELIAQMHAVSGVLSVVLHSFQLVGASLATAQVLHALPARWDAQRQTILGAQLLTLSDAALTLQMETADE